MTEILNIVNQIHKLTRQMFRYTNSATNFASSANLLARDRSAPRCLFSLNQRVLAIASLLALTAGCDSAHHEKLSALLDQGSGIISTRDNSTPDQVIAMVKLKSPALLAQPKNVNGKMQVDAALSARIDKEQAALIANLQKADSRVQVLYKYKMVLNAVNLLVPGSLADKLGQYGDVAYTEGEGTFTKPVLDDSISKPNGVDDFSVATSVKWIGAETLHAQGIRGQGVKIGIIDTGIDYTHLMLGGSGKPGDYQAIDPAQSNAAFPNSRVVGGMDFVGTNFDSGSPVVANHIPHPDANPLDEAGHGSHVSGTVAGHGDGINSYDGVAPDATLYALKVFGKTGSTSDGAVIAAMEFAADPNRKGTGEGRLDVVNLSLGSPFGVPHVLYAEAAGNLINGGTIMVAAAGNEGPVPYILGSPSMVDNVISVAANTDNTLHNWEMPASLFTGPDQTLYSPVIEGPISTPVASAGNVQGTLVDIGLAATDLTADQATAVKGHVALITRGQVSFSDKIKRAVAGGAIGVVMMNNQPGDPIEMGGDGNYPIPAIMVSQTDAAIITAQMAKGPVTIQFQTTQVLKDPTKIDAIASFSSQGPRQVDGLLKPEITAPGVNVISAAMGQAFKSVQMSGTSMATPHMTGVMALLRQVYPKLSVLELKSIVMGRSVTIADATKAPYSIVRQGAGRVQVDRAATSPIVANKTSFSYGEQSIEKTRSISDQVTLKNLTNKSQSFQMSFVSNTTSDLSVSMLGATELTVAANQSKTVPVTFVLDASRTTNSVLVFEGWLILSQNGSEAYRIPMLATTHRVSDISASSLTIQAPDESQAAGKAVALTLTNKGGNPGRAFLFNRLGQAARVKNSDPYKNTFCSIKSAGYRLVPQTVDGQTVNMLQVAVELYQPLPDFHNCEISVLLGGQVNGTADQELALSMDSNVSGLQLPPDSTYAMDSLLLDAVKAQTLVQGFSQALKANPTTPPTLDLTSALIDVEPSIVYQNTTIAIVQADVTKLNPLANGDLQVKVLTTNDSESAAVTDDYLGSDLKTWQKINIADGGQGYTKLPSEVDLGAGLNQQVQIQKGSGPESLMVLIPDNVATQNGGVSKQSQTLSPLFAK